MCAIDNIEPANLDPDETRRFRNIISTLSKDSLTGNNENIEREKERRSRDVDESHKFEEREERKNEDSDMEGMTDCYRILKNNELLGQILRSNYGCLKKFVLLKSSKQFQMADYDL